MLTWIAMECESGYIGLDDGCPCYFVRKDEDGWYWEDSWGFGYGGYDSAEEAKAEAEADCPGPAYGEVGFSAEELDEIIACMEAHERMESAKFGKW